LRGIQKHIDEFAAQRIKPVAISVDPPDVSKRFKKRRGFTFTFLSDPNSEVIRRYDLLHVGGGPENKISLILPSSFWTHREPCAG